MSKISDALYKFCQSNVTVTSEVAKDPSQKPGDVFKHLYHEGRILDEAEELKKPDHSKDIHDYGEEALQHAFECGKWGKTRPSRLFLQVRACSLSLR